MESSDPAVDGEPPSDANEWTDEQWLDWLKATDASVDGDASPVTLAGKVVHSSGGQVLGQSMIGMAHAIYGQHHDEVIIVAEANSKPEKDKPFAVHLDPDHPERSTVVFDSDSESDADKETAT